MARFSQENRAFKVFTALPPDELLLQRFNGEEGISMPFAFNLELISEEEAVDPADLLRQPMVIVMNHPAEERVIHGLVRRFTQFGQSEDLTFYRAEIVPWLWFLKLSEECKIFQNMTVLEIAQEVFDGLGYQDYEIRCTQSYQPREYCVQYRETHFNFVSRLFEEEGIFYFFEHTEEKHTLVLADDNSAAAPCPGQERARMVIDEGPFQEEDVVTDLRMESSVNIGTVTLRDYNFTKPSLNLESAAAEEEGEEIYRYPGRYEELSEGERYARILLERNQREGQLIRGTGSCRMFRSGFKFDLEDHYRDDANQSYMLLHVSHHAEAGDYRSWETAPLEYRNGFVGLPLSVPYRPPRRARKPRIPGSQTAVVVGKSGEEIWTDEYGRVKVQFYWDRVGEMDENSSRWVRVSQEWAGKQWGSMHIPRIGQEVIVEFLEGDPDRPIITGRVYNAEQTVPWSLPDEQTKSGMKSRSSKGGGGYNEISIDDKKGSEKVTIHAQKDMDTTVGNDQTRDITNNRTTTVGVDDSEEVGSNQSVSVGADQTLDVAANQTISVGADRTVNVGASESVTVTADQTIDVTGNRTATVSGEDGVSAATNLTRSAGANVEITAGAMGTFEAGATIEVTAGATIKLSAGGSSIEIGPAGVTINTAALVQVKGSAIKLN